MCAKTDRGEARVTYYKVTGMGRGLLMMLLAKEYTAVTSICTVSARC